MLAFYNIVWLTILCFYAGWTRGDATFFFMGCHLWAMANLVLAIRKKV